MIRRLRPRWLAVILIVICAGVAKASGVSSKVIYGQDNRKDFYQVQDPLFRKVADSSVALIRASDLHNDGQWTSITTSPYGYSMSLCASEPFYTQGTAAFCSGFLVTPDIVATAGHCVRTQDQCDSTRFVFDFRLNSADDTADRVASTDVYSCKKLIHSVSEAVGEDFSLIELDHPVQGHSPLKIREQGAPAVGDPLVLMGYPSGLPLKIAGEANIRAVQDKFITANTDSYGGNSGSAVFNAQTGVVEGILVRGERDFTWINGCRVSNVCPDDGCRGEDSTRIDRIEPYLPKSAH